MFILTFVYYCLIQRNPKREPLSSKQDVPKKSIYNGQIQEDYTKVALNEGVVNYPPGEEQEDEHDDTTDDDEEYDINEASNYNSRNE
jgi:hypothetical protein